MSKKPVTRAAQRGIIKLASENTQTITSLSSRRGTKYLRFDVGDLPIYIPVSTIAASPATLFELLAAGNYFLIGRSAQSAYLEKVRIVVERGNFPPTDLIERPGWSGVHFALLSGEVISPAGTEKPVVLFRGRPQAVARAGHRIAWRREVARLAAPHSVVAFLIGVSFAASVLELADRQDNPGFEFAGDGGRGKSTAQKIAASTVGDGVNGSYVLSFDATLNSLDEVMPMYADHPIFFDEANSHGSGKVGRARAEATKDFVFKMASGTGKRRMGSPEPEKTRFTYSTSSNEPLADLLSGMPESVAGAALDRLLTVQIAGPEERPYGTFDMLPAGINSEELARLLTDAARRNHGTAFPYFVEKLVHARARDESVLRAAIRTHISHFQRSVKVDFNNGSASRVAEAFGLVYAAMVMAREWKVLPRNWQPHETALRCYQLYRAGTSAPLSARQVLVSLANSSATIDLRRSVRPTLTDEELDHAVFLDRAPKGKVALMLTKASLDYHHRQGDLLLRDPRVDVRRDGRHWSRKMTVRAGQGQDRVVYILLDESEIA